MRISLWTPGSEPGLLFTERYDQPDGQTLITESADGAWRYTIRAVDPEVSLLDERTLTEPVRVLFSKQYVGEIPDGLDPHALLEGGAGWARTVPHRDGELLLDIVLTA